MIDVDINAALVQAYQDAALGLPTGYEGKDFTPPDSAPWAQLWTLPAGSPVAGLGLHAPIRHAGIFQIDVNYPPNSGTGVFLAAAGVIRAAFAPGTVYTYNGVNVRCDRCDRSAIRSGKGWDTMSMSITYVAYEIR